MPAWHTHCWQQSPQGQQMFAGWHSQPSPRCLRNGWVLCSCSLGAGSESWTESCGENSDKVLEEGRSHAAAVIFWANAEDLLGSSLQETLSERLGCWTIPGRLKEKKSKLEGWQNKQASHLKSKHIQNPPPLKEILPAACPAALCLQQLQWQALQSLICMSGRAPEANRLEIWRHCSRRSCCKRALPRASRIFKCQSGRELAEETSRGAAQAAKSWACWAEL